MAGEMEWLEEGKLSGLSEQLEQLFPEFSVDFSKLTELVLRGKAGEAFRLLFSSLKNGMEAEAAGLRNLMISLLLIGLLAALLTVLTAAFRNHQISDLAHFLSCLLMLSVILTVFDRSLQTAEELLGKLLTFVRLFVPTFMTALGLSAGAATAAGYYQLILLLIYGVEQFLMSMGLPFLNACMLLVMMNSLWGEERLDALLDFLNKSATGLLRLMMTVMAGFSLLQSMVTPVLEQLKQSAASKALSAIPGLGGLAEGTSQLLLGSAVLVKNGLGLAGILLLLAFCALPLIRLCLYAGILRLCAGLVGLMADRQLTGCISRAGDVLWLMVRMVYTAGACFLILFAVIICLAGTVR